MPQIERLEPFHNQWISLDEIMGACRLPSWKVGDYTGIGTDPPNCKSRFVSDSHTRWHRLDEGKIGMAVLDLGELALSRESFPDLEDCPHIVWLILKQEGIFRYNPFRDKMEVFGETVLDGSLSDGSGQDEGNDICQARSMVEKLPCES